MPVIFIHGVNTREEDAGYAADLAARDELIQRLILTPLAAAKGERFAGMKVANVYWGKHGVQFYWNQATVPEVGLLQSLGPGEGTPVADLEMATTLAELTRPTVPGGPLEELGGGEGQLRQAARADLVRFVEAVISPVIHSEFALDEDSELSPQQRGSSEAVLAIATCEVANDPAVLTAVRKAGSDDEMMDLLEARVVARFQELLNQPAASQTSGTPSAEVEGLGSSWFAAFQERIGELFDRARGLPGRLASTTVLELYREGLHNQLTRFLGDVFIYLKERDDAGGPGPILRAVREQLQAAPRQRRDEPLIVLTHSMGGNIFYDLVTSYDSNLTVDAWVSVGGQVGQFEEMKLFKNSDKAIRAPQKVRGLKPDRVRFWLNIYDPADVLSFLAAPVFEDAVDAPFHTGVSALKSHGDYFKRASFYHLVRARLEEALL